ncbi:hypothetical protein Asal01_03082 [Fodinibius salicampi]
MRLSTAFYNRKFESINFDLNYYNKGKNGLQIFLQLLLQSLKSLIK